MKTDDQPAADDAGSPFDQHLYDAVIARCSGIPYETPSTKAAYSLGVTDAAEEAARIVAERTPRIDPSSAEQVRVITDNMPFPRGMGGRRVEEYARRTLDALAKHIDKEPE